MDWVLKILSGSSEGAQIDLEPGEYLIGKGDQCDLVLDDQHVAEQHFVLTITEETADLRLLAEQDEHATKPRLNGVLDEQTQWALDSVSVISLETFHFVLAQANQDLNQVVIPEPVDNTPLAADEETTEPEETDALVSDPVDRPSITKHPLAEAIRSFGNKVALTLSLGVVVITASAMMVSTSEPEPIPEPKASVQELEEILQHAGINNVELEHKGERLIVKGFVADDTEKKRIADVLIDEQPLDYAVTNLAQLKHAAELSLAAHGLKDINVAQGDDPGTLTLSGVSPDREKWKKVLLSLKNDLPLVSEWDDQVGIAPKPEIPPLDVSSVSMGQVPFAVTRDGERRFIGNSLGNGYQIEDINLQYLLVSRGAEMVKVQLTF